MIRAKAAIATIVSLIKMTYQRYIPVAKEAQDSNEVNIALISQTLYTVITRMWRQLKYVGPVSKTAKAVPNAIATGSTEMNASFHPEAWRNYLFGR